jgi:hypothetical protein
MSEKRSAFKRTSTATKGMRGSTRHGSSGGVSFQLCFRKLASVWQKNLENNLI